MNPFSILTSKIFAGTSVVLLLTLIALKISTGIQIKTRDEMLEKQSDQIVELKANNSTLRANQSELEKGVAQCNASVAVAAAKANEAAAAGTAALNEVRRSGGRVTSAIAAIQAMPAASCADAEAILRGAAQ